MIVNSRTQKMCSWSGALFVGFLFAGFLTAGFVPPPKPSADATTIARFYAEHSYAIRIGMILSCFGIMMWVPFSAAISVHLRRIEGERAPLAFAQLGIGATLPPVFILTLYFFVAAAFRPERDVEAIKTLNDYGWIAFVGIIYGILAQNLVIGAGVLSDDRDDPIFPRWFGYFSVWVGLLYVPACLDAFFHDGPLAWDGLFTWWLSIAAYFIWVVTMIVVLLRADTKQLRSAPGARPSVEELYARVDGLGADLAVVRDQLGELRTGAAP